MSANCAAVIVTQELLLSSRLTLILNLFFIVLFYKPQGAISPCTLGIPAFVMLNTMSSYVYRNMRLGYYRDYSITSSAIDRALQAPDQTSQPDREIVFKRGTAKSLDSDLEAGNSDLEEKVDELVDSGDVTGSRKTDV